MSAQDLTFAEIVNATTWLTGAGPIGEWFRASDVGRIFSPELSATLLIIARAPAESSEPGRIVAALAEEDAVHRRDLHFLDGMLLTVAEHHYDAALRTDAAMLHALLLPDGVTLANRSYAEEAGRGAARAAVLTPEVRASLARLPVASPDGASANLDAWLTAHLQASAARLQALLDDRTRVGADSGPSPNEMLDAKRRFIAVLAQVFATFRTLDARLTESDRVKVAAIKAQWSDVVRAATARAVHRRAVAHAAPATPAPAA